MAVTIERLDLEVDGRTHAEIRHGNHVFDALVNGRKEDLQSLLGDTLFVEMAFERVADWRELPDFHDGQSCISASTSHAGAVVLRGRVHSVMSLDGGVSLIDLYLQAGPEFLTVDSDELGGAVPREGTALEITVQGLCFFPTHY